MYDLLIQNARICDGSGEPAFAGAVAINAGRIVAVGAMTGEARAVVDAGGLVLAPGFIDQHTHYDAQLVWDGLAQPAIEHGVTTIMPGNCSLSLAPLKAEHRGYLGETFRKIEEMPKAAFDAGLTWSWQSFEEYLATIRNGLGINVAPIVGQSLIRLWVMGHDSRNRAATDAEIADMQVLLRQCLDAGAVAMSSSWVDVDVGNRPVPCRLGEPKELDALCAVLGEHGAVLQIVPEFWDIDLLDVRIDILADLSRKHGITTTFSPLFDSNATPDLTARALARVRLQTINGARVVPQMQVRPIDLAFELDGVSPLFSTLPGWWKLLLGSRDEIMAGFQDRETRHALVAETSGMTLPMGLDVYFDNAIVKRASRPENQPLLGRTLGEIAKERGTSAVDMMIEIAVSERLSASFGFEAIGHNAADKIGDFLADKLISIGAGDGGAHVSRFSTYGDTGHLFARYVRVPGGMPLEEAVRKLTSDVAKAWGVADRGLIRPGYAADLVLFDPDTIDRGPEIAVTDLPGDGFRYIRHAVGIAKVWINGALTYDARAGYTAARAGAITTLAGGGTVRITAGSPPALRRWTYPQAGDDWQRLAARALPELPVEDAVSQLQSWNLYLAYRAAPAEITPTDILFVEPPLAAS